MGATMLLLLSIFSLPSLFEAQARVNKQPPPVYNSSLYWNVDTGPVPSADILKCRFEKDCCWSPTVNSSKWYLLQEQENKEALMKTFNLTSPSDVPKGNHLATVLAVRENKLSIFRSCSFCAHRKITVKFRYWITRFVKLQVCWHDAFFESQLEHELQGQTFAGNHCRTVDPTHQPGPLRVDFFVPPGTIVEIVFVVSNTRRYYGGGMVILDDLSVGGRLCGENRKTRRPEPFTTAPVTIRKDTPAPDPFEQLFGRDFAHFLDSDFSTLNEDVTNAPTTTKTPTTFVESGVKLRSTARLIRVATPQANSTIWGPRRSVLDSNGSPTFRRKLLSSLRRPFPSLDQKLQKSAAPNASSAPRLPPKNLRQKDIRRPCATPGACTFEFGACNYTNSGAIRSRALFRVFTAADDNRGHPFGLTGISDAAEGKKYIRAETKGGDLAVFEADVNLQEDTEVAFDVYESTSGQQLSACCFTPNQLPQPLVCPFSTNLGVSATDRRWQPGKFTCHKGATKIVFMCENYGHFLGVCAIDDIQLYRKTATGLEFRCD